MILKHDCHYVSLVLGYCLCLPMVAAGDGIVANDQELRFESFSFPYEQDLTIEGFVEGKEFMSMSGEANRIHPIRINGIAVADELLILLTAPSQDEKEKIKALRRGVACRIKGKLMNARSFGLKAECYVIVDEFHEMEIEPIRLHEFVGRTVCLVGVAKGNNQFQLGEESARVSTNSDWPTRLYGHEIQLTGTLVKDGGELVFTNSKWSPSALEDMEGKEVELAGSLYIYNTFKYQSTEVYLISKHGPPLNIESSNHGRMAKVRGKLVRQLRPPIHRRNKETEPLVFEYAIQNATIEYAEDAKSWFDRFGTLFLQRPTKRNGVFELVDELGFRRNLTGNESRATLLAERNAKQIQSILGDWNESVSEEIAIRMVDEQSPHELRLLYASMLASAGDQRGRKALLDAVETRDGFVDLNAYYALCLAIGMEPAVPNQEANSSIDWCEGWLLEAVSDSTMVTYKGVQGYKEEVPRSQIAELSGIISILITKGTSQTRAKLLELCLNGPNPRRGLIYHFLLRKDTSIETLRQFIVRCRGDRERRAVLFSLLNRREYDDLDQFKDILQGDYVYMDIRESITPELLRKLSEYDFGEKWTNELSVWKALTYKEPLQGLLSALNDPTVSDKNLIFYELQNMSHADGVSPIAEILKNAPVDFMAKMPNQSREGAIEHAIKAISQTGTHNAIRHLIELLNCDFARFLAVEEGEKALSKPKTLQVLVAKHLIDLTGESFGVDQVQWLKWLSEHPEFSVPRKLSYPNSDSRVTASGFVDVGNP